MLHLPGCVELRLAGLCTWAEFITLVTPLVPTAHECSPPAPPPRPPRSALSSILSAMTSISASPHTPPAGTVPVEEKPPSAPSAAPSHLRAAAALSSIAYAHNGNSNGDGDVEKSVSERGGTATSSAVRVPVPVPVPGLQLVSEVWKEDHAKPWGSTSTAPGHGEARTAGGGDGAERAAQKAHTSKVLGETLNEYLAKSFGNTGFGLV